MRIDDQKTERDIARMRTAGKAVAQALLTMSLAIQEGERSTLALDELAAVVLRNNGAEPCMNGYQPPFHKDPYPYNTCISVNAEVVHGLPSARKILRDGDLVKLDTAGGVEGWYADSAITVAVGDVSDAAKNLSLVTRQALMEGVKAAKPGAYLGDIGWAIYNHVTKHHYHIAEGLSGHFIGSSIHEEPSVENASLKGQGLKLEPGMTLCIEPMVNIGTPTVLGSAANMWEVLTADRSLSAHWEHTVLITSSGAEILTRA